jgi:hypothetical protein
MVDRKLREDRHPRHPATVRENIVPSTFFFFFFLSCWLTLTGPSVHRYL